MRWPLLKPDGFGVVTPGASSVSAIGLRLISGVLLIVSALITVPTCVVSVCNCAASPETVTVSRDAADLHANVEARSLVDLERERPEHVGLEALGLDSQFVAADRNARKRVNAIFVRGGRPIGSAVDILGGNVRADDGAARGSVTRPVIPALTSWAYMEMLPRSVTAARIANFLICKTPFCESKTLVLKTCVCGSNYIGMSHKVEGVACKTSAGFDAAGTGVIHSARGSKNVSPGRRRDAAARRAGGRP